MRYLAAQWPVLAKVYPVDVRALVERDEAGIEFVDPGSTRFRVAMMQAGRSRRRQLLRWYIKRAWYAVRRWAGR